MTAKLFLALYIGLFVGMFVLMFANFPVGWVFFAFLFITVFGGIFLIERPYIIAGLFLLASLIVLVLGLWGLSQSAQISNWSTSAGVITRSWFCTRSVNLEVVYSGPCIEYRYQVKGEPYEASSIDTQEFLGRWWMNIPEKYAQGKEVKVYYNPTDPRVSRLEADIPPRDWITLAIGGMMAVLSIVTLVQSVLNPPPMFPFIAPIRPRPQKRIPDIGEQLEKLAELHRQHALTDAEYELAKRRLLGD